MSDSAPSRLNRLAPGNTRCRYCSNSSAAMSWNIRCSVSSASSCGLIEDRLHPRGEPVALRLVGDADELNAERAAVGQAELLDQVAERAVGRAVESADADFAIQVRVCHSEVGQIEQWVVRAIVPERIEMGDEMSKLAIAVDQVEDAHVERPGRQRGSRASRRSCVRAPLRIPRRKRATARGQSGSFRYCS